MIHGVMKMIQIIIKIGAMRIKLVIRKEQLDGGTVMKIMIINREVDGVMRIRQEQQIGVAIQWASKKMGKELDPRNVLIATKKDICPMNVLSQRNLEDQRSVLIVEKKDTCQMNVLSQRNQEKVEEDQGNALIAVRKDILQGIVHNLESLEKVEEDLRSVLIAGKKDIW